MLNRSEQFVLMRSRPERGGSPDEIGVKLFRLDSLCDPKVAGGVAESADFYHGRIVAERILNRTISTRCLGSLPSGSKGTELGSGVQSFEFSST